MPISSSAQQTAATTPRSSPSSSQTAWTKESAYKIGHYAGRSSEGDNYAVYSFPSSGSATGTHTASIPSDQWWEHVLPPGQLAERLRRAQISTEPRSTPSSSSAVRRFKAPLAGATPSERKVWKGFSELDKGDAVRQRTSDKSNRSSSASASADNSSDENASHLEEQSPGGRTSILGHYDDLDAMLREDRTWSSLSRNQSSRFSSRSGSSRRLRVMSEDELGLGFDPTATSIAPSSKAAGKKSAHDAHLRHFAYSGFVSPTLSDTPEVSSNDESDDRSSTTTTTTTTRHSRTVSMTATVRSSQSFTPPTILRSHFDRTKDGVESIYEPSGLVDAPVSDRSRHVSFNGDMRSTARAAAKRHSLPTSQPAFAFERQQARDPYGAFEGFASRSNSTRRSRHGVRSGIDRRSSSFSAPVSRRGSMHFDGPATAGSSGTATPVSRPTSHGRIASIPDLALLDSLNVAQNQLATAGNLAVTLTRQLSAPLRPVFHLTLFLSISSITLVSLACFLAAGYLLTAWDDLALRTHKVGSAAGTARKNIKATVSWGIKMLVSETPAASRPQPQRTAAVPGGPEMTTTANGYDIPSPSPPGQKQRARSHFVWPVDVAFAGASAVAFRVVPKSVFEAFGIPPGSDAGADRASAASRGNRAARDAGPRPSSTPRMPPRPPLSLLLPSIFFTLLIALSAGLASFASRRAAAEAGSGFFSKSGYRPSGDASDQIPTSASTAAFFQPSEAIGRGGSGSSSSERRRSRNAAYSPSMDADAERFAAAALPVLASRA